MSTKPVPPMLAACALAVIAGGCTAPTASDVPDSAPTIATGPQPILASVLTSTGRIAVDADGNQHDKDDWAATPMTLAILARQDLQSRLVHYTYNNHLGNNSTTMASTMKRGVLDGATYFGFDLSKFFDAQTNLSGTIASLKREIEASSATNRLFVLAAGPMEVLYRAVKASASGKRQYVTVISHSPWNNKHRDTRQMTHTATSVQNLGVKWIQIPSQNPALYTSSWDPWTWLVSPADPRLRWVYDRMQLTGKPDVSDAGMCYYLLTSDQNTTPAKLEAFFGDWVVAPEPPPEPALVALAGR